MKTKLKKSALLALAIGLTINSIAYADDASSVTSNSDHTAVVTYQGVSSFAVSLPTDIVLNSAGEGTYTVSVSGDIAGYNTVTVLPDSGFFLTQGITEGSKPQVEAIVTQEQTKFSSQDVQNNTVVNGTITAPDISAGKWKGGFNFYVNINENHIPIVDLEVEESNMSKINNSNFYFIGDSIFEGAENNYKGPDYYLDVYYSTKSKNLSQAKVSYAAGEESYSGPSTSFYTQISTLTTKLWSFRHTEGNCATKNNCGIQGASNAFVFSCGIQDIIENGVDLLGYQLNLIAGVKDINKNFTCSDIPTKDRVKIIYVVPSKKMLKTAFALNGQTLSDDEINTYYEGILSTTYASKPLTEAYVFSFVELESILTDDDYASDLALNESGYVKLAKAIATTYVASRL